MTGCDRLTRLADLYLNDNRLTFKLHPTQPTYVSRQSRSGQHSGVAVLPRGLASGVRALDLVASRWPALRSTGLLLKAMVPGRYGKSERAGPGPDFGSVPPGIPPQPPSRGGVGWGGAACGAKTRSRTGPLRLSLTPRYPAGPQFYAMVTLCLAAP